MTYYSYGDTYSGPFSLTGKWGLTVALAVLALAVWLVIAPAIEVTSWTGTCFRGIFPPDLSAAGARWINFGLLVVAALYAASFTKHINFLPSTNLLYSTALLLMCAATPQVISGICRGTLLLLVTLICLNILFSLSGRRRSAEGIFLIFGFLSWGSCIQGSFLLLMPVFMLCSLFCGHLKLRGFVAMLLGIAAPYWILLACGVVEPKVLSFPAYLNIGTLKSVDFPMFRLLLTVGITSLLYLAMLLVNSVSHASAGATLRARWSCIHLIGFSMLVYMLTDFGHITDYLPAFYLFTGYECAQWSTRLRTVQKSYLAITLFTIYIALFAVFRLVG